jgi:hypothetical protein
VQAADMFEEGGTSQAEIAQRLHVAHQTVSYWHDLWEQGRRDAVRAKGRAGRLPKLNSGQLARVEDALLQGAEAHGYPNDLWTLGAPRRGDRGADRGCPSIGTRCGGCSKISSAGPTSGRLAERPSATRRPSTLGPRTAGLR